jgi:branched-chain amino acid transport system permease protein
MAKLKNKKVQFLLVGLIFILSVCFFPYKTSTITMMSTVVVYAIAAIGYNVLLGSTGQISLGHAAFMGLGAYVAAFITNNLGLPFIVGFVLAGIIPLILGLLLGLVALRLEGHYLAIATLGFGVAIQQTFKTLTGFTKGFAGQTAPEAKFFGASITGPFYLIFVVIILVLICILTYNILNSRTGRAFVAMRDSLHSAQAMGIDVVKYKLIAFSLSAFYAGIAGSLYIHLVKYTQPDVWSLTVSLNLLAMVVIGGLASIEGSILGAAFIVLMPHLILEIPVLNKIPSSATIFTGLMIFIIIKFRPSGLVSIKDLFKKKELELGGAEDGITESR